MNCTYYFILNASISFRCFIDVILVDPLDDVFFDLASKYNNMQDRLQDRSHNIMMQHNLRRSRSEATCVKVDNLFQK